MNVEFGDQLKEYSYYPDRRQEISESLNRSHRDAIDHDVEKRNRHKAKIIRESILSKRSSTLVYNNFNIDMSKLNNESYYQQPSVMNKGGSRFEDDNEQFWAAIINNDYSSISSTVQFQHTLVSKLRSGIHPSRMRGQVWQALSRSSLLHLDTLYAQLKDEPTSYEALIKRDIHRTFPNTDMFSQESGQRALERILRAYSLYDTDVGYCQGLAFLVGPLLLNMSEEETFCVLIRLMETYGMRTLFTLDMEGLHLRLFQLDVLLLEFLPNLHHFLNTIHEIHPQMYASHWFLTVFAYNFPLPLVYRIYDIMFAEGPIETVLRLALTLLKKSLAEIMALTEFEDIMDYLSVKLIDPYNGNYDLMIEEAMAFGELVTKKKLDAIEKKFSAIQTIKMETQQQSNFANKQRPVKSVTTTSNKKSTNKKSGWFGTLQKSMTFKKTTAIHASNDLPQQNLTSNASHPLARPRTVHHSEQLQNTKHSNKSNDSEALQLHQQIDELVSALAEVQQNNRMLNKKIANLTSSSTSASQEQVVPVVTPGLSKEESEIPVLRNKNKFNIASDNHNQHSYGCNLKRHSVLTEIYKEHCYCELERLLAAANLRISNLEAALHEQQQHNGRSYVPSMARSSSISSNSSSSSSLSSSSSYEMNHPPSPVLPTKNYQCDELPSLIPGKNQFETMIMPSHYSKEDVLKTSSFHVQQHKAIRRQY